MKPRRRAVGLVAAVGVVVFAAAALAGVGSPKTKLVSKTSGGDPATGFSSGEPVITPSGRFVGFDSLASNLPGGSTGWYEVYIRDRKTGKTRLVSKTSGGDPATGGDSSDPSLSSNGRFVAFESYATNLPGSIGPSFDQAYVHDMKTGKTKLLSRTNAGDPAAGGSSEDASISDDGRFVLFESGATNLPDSINPDFQVYLRDLKTRKTKLVSKTSAGDPANADSDDPAISGNGRFLGFESSASNFPGQISPDYEVYVRDQRTGKTKLVSRNSAGSPADGDSQDVELSASGRFVGFESLSTNLAGNGVDKEAYLRDRKTGKTQLVSKTNGGAPASGGESEDASPSNDGRSVAFESEATNLGGLATGIDQIFVRDRKQGRTKLVSKANDGSPADSFSFIHKSTNVLTSDGRFVVFESYGTNLPGSIGPTYGQVYIRGPLH